MRKILWLLNIVIGGAIFWLGADMALTWNQERRDERPITPKPTGQNSPKGTLKPASKPIDAFRQIAELNVFKTTDTEAETEKKEEDEPEEIKVTELDLKLMGTVVGENGPSFAVIQDGKARKQELYYLKDYVQGAQISKILADRVILSLKGKEEALILSDDSEPSPGRTQISRLPERTTTPQRVIRRPSPTVRRPVARRPIPPVTRVKPPQESGEEEPEKEKEEEEPETDQEETEKRPAQRVRGNIGERPGEEKGQ